MRRGKERRTRRKEHGGRAEGGKGAKTNGRGANEERGKKKKRKQIKFYVQALLVQSCSFDLMIIYIPLSNYNSWEFQTKNKLNDRSL